MSWRHARAALPPALVSGAAQCRYRVTRAQLDFVEVGGSSFPFGCIQPDGILLGNVPNAYRDQALEHWSRTPLCNQNREVLREFLSMEKPSNPRFAKEFIKDLDYDKFFDWMSGAIEAWSTTYYPKIVRLIDSEYRGLAVDKPIIHMFANSVRIRLFPLMLSILYDKVISEEALISYIPHPSKLGDEEQTEDLILSKTVYRRVAHMSLNSPMPFLIGPNILVHHAGLDIPAYVDFRCSGVKSDYILYGHLLPGADTLINGRRYVAHQHVETPDSITCVPHFRLSCSNGECYMDGTYIPMPTPCLRPLRYILKSRGTSPLDAIIHPVSVLNSLQHGQSVMTLIDIAVGNRYYGGDMTVTAITRFALNNPTPIPHKYYLSREVVRSLSHASKDVKELIQLYFDT